MRKFMKTALKLMLVVCLAISTMSLITSCGFDGTPETTVNYTVTFDADGGSSVEKAVVESGKTVAEPTAPTKAHYEFAGWYNGETAWNFPQDTVSSDLTLKAKWTAIEYSVVFVDFAGEEETLTYTIETVEDFTLPAVPTVPVGHENARWSMTEDEILVFAETPVRVEAVADVIEYTVSLLNEDDSEFDSFEIAYGGKITAPETNPAKNHYTFDGWYNGETAWDFASDVVTSEVTLKAQFTAIPYTVVFVDFAGEETTLTYTVENVSEFALPQVPTAPEGKENARWNKTLAECVVYSNEAIRVEAVADVIMLDVELLQADGTAIESLEIAYGSGIELVPELDGYLFKFWMKDDGEIFAGEVKEDLTLYACWYKVVAEGKKEVISAEYVFENTQVEYGYANNTENGTGVYENENSGWYYDSDYDDYYGTGGGLAINQFIKWFKITLTADGGAGVVEEGRETYLIFPEINYNLYSKVDFAINLSKVKNLDVYGTVIDTLYDNNLFSIRTESDGVYLYFQKINTFGTGREKEVRVKLPESVADGTEGLRLNLSVTGWFRIAITEFHATSRTYDYQAELISSIETLIADPTDADALNAYLKAVDCLTEYEKAVYEAPESVIVAISGSLANAVENAASDAELFDAVDEYKEFYKGLNEQEKTYVADDLAKVNAIIELNRYELGEVQAISNVISITQNGEAKGEMNITHEQNPNSKFNGTEYKTFSYRQNSSGTADVIFTLGAFDYSSVVEARFAIAFAVTGEEVGTVTINGATLTMPNELIGNFYKMEAVIADGWLTLVDAGSANDVTTKDTNFAQYGYYLKVQLGDAINKGKESLVVTFGGFAGKYAWMEITGMNVLPFATTSTAIDAVGTISTTASSEINVPIVEASSSKFKDTAKYPYTTFTYSNGNIENATFTLKAMNYSDYDEVCFGIAHAMTYETAGSMTIAGQTFTVPSRWFGGYMYRMKATIKNGILTVTNDGSQEAGMAVSPYYLQVALSESVLNGNEGLVITFTQNGSSYAWLEVTNMIAVSKVLKDEATQSFVIDNAVTLETTASIGSSLRYEDSTYWGTGAHTAFNTSYTKQNLVSFNAATEPYTATFTLPMINFSKYDESYFGFTAATAEGDCKVTINGQSYTYDLNKGYLYVKMIIVGNTLKVVGDGAKNAGTVYMTVELPANVLNGTESLVITWETAGWSQVEITEMHAVKTLSAIA